MLPTGPMGDVVHDCGVHAGVDMSLVLRVPDADVGVFTVIPEMQSVHYQRRHSAFALHNPALLSWSNVRPPCRIISHAQILHREQDGVKTWLHMTGITPMISAAV